MADVVGVEGAEGEPAGLADRRAEQRGVAGRVLEDGRLDVGGFCLSGFLSKPQDVVWGRGSTAVSKESAPVSVGIRHRGGLPTVPGRLSLAGRVRLSSV